MKIKEFKTIANGVIETIKKIIEFKFNYKSYLNDKEITDEKINKIIEKLTLVFVDYEKDKSEEKETFVLETLLGFSFFNNHELFKKLQPKINKDLKEIFENLFGRDIFSVSLNDFSKDEMIKNIELINDETINIFCLAYALKKDNEKLVNILKTKIDFNNLQNKKEIKENFLNLIIFYGSDIKNEKNKKLIKDLLENKSIDDLFKSYNLNAKRIKNIDKFFNISLKNEMLNDKVNLETQNIDDNFVLKLLSKNSKNSKDFERIKNLLAYKDSKDLKKNINKLKSKKLLDNDFFEKILTEIENFEYSKSLKSKNTLINLFKELEDLNLSEDIKKKSYEKLKDIAIDGQYSENKDYKEFILQYPLELSIEEFVKILIHKNQGYVGLTDYETNLKTNLNNNYPEYFDEIIHINIKDKFFNSIHKEIDDFFNDLLKKHKEKMNDINCFKLYVERSSNDFLVKKYLDYFKNTYGIEKIKEIQFSKINILNEDNVGGLTLTWFIENNLIDKLINNNNSLINFGNPKKNFLVEDLIKNYHISPDFFIKQSLQSFIYNDKLFKFILHNFETKEQTKQFICNSVVSIDAEDLAKEIVKKGIIPNEYYQEKFKTSPNSASNILLKGVLKKKLENLENKELKKEKRLKI